MQLRYGHVRVLQSHVTAYNPMFIVSSPCHPYCKYVGFYFQMLSQISSIGRRSSWFEALGESKIMTLLFSSFNLVIDPLTCHRHDARIQGRPLSRC